MNRKRILRTVIAVLLVSAAFFIAAILAVRSAQFHQYLLATAIERAQRALGGRVEIGDFNFHWSGMKMDMFRVAVYGTQREPQPPLLQAEHIAIGLKLVSFWKRKIDLQDIVIDHPVIHYLVNQQGRTNLPQSPQEPGRPPVSIFDLAVGHIVINQGEVVYHDRKTPLQAELRGLEAKISSVAFQKAYDGTLSYRDGRLKYGDFNPLQHDLESQFTATPAGITLKSLRLSSGSSWLTARASLQDYGNPTVDGDYVAEISTAELGEFLRNHSLPLGQIATQGAVQYRNKPGQAFLTSLSVQGQLTSTTLAMQSPQARVGLRALSGKYSLNQGDLEAPDLQADVLGGHFSGDLSVRHLAGTADGRLAASFKNFSLAATNAALTAKPLDDAKITGHTDGTINATWHGNLEAIQLHSDATIAAAKPVVEELPGSPSAVPLNGTVHLSYDGRSNTVSLQDTTLRAPHTAINLNGTLATHSSMRIQARSDDLREVDVLTAAFRKPAENTARSVPKSRLLGLGGSASFIGQLQGTTKAPHLSGQLQGENIWYAGTNLRTLRARLEAGPSEIVLHEGQLQIGSQGNVQFDAEVGLANWSYQQSNPLHLRATANSLPVDTIQRLAHLQYPVTGNLSGQVSIQGSLANPSGQASMRLSGANAWGQPIQELSVQLQAAGDSIHSNWNVRTPAGSGSATGTYYPSEDGFEAHADIRGMQIGKLELVRNRNLQLNGVVNVSARGSGTIRAPEIDASIEASKVQFRGQSLDGLKVHANVARGLAAITLDSKISGASIQARGTVNLNANYDATATIDTQTIQLGPLLGSYLHGHVQEFRGQTQLHASLEGPLKVPQRVQANVDISNLSVGYQSVELSGAGPIRVNYRNGILTLDRADLKGTGTDVQLRAVVPVTGDGELRAAATGTVDLRVAQVILPGSQSSGQLKLDVSAGGSRAHPDFHGGVRLIDGTFQYPDAPLGLEKVNAELAVERNRVLIKSFTAQSGGGSLTGQGSVTYSPVQFDLAVAGRGVRLRYPEGVRAVLRSDLTLNGTPDSAVLSGQVLLNRLSATDSFDLAALLDQFTASPAPSEDSWTQNTRLNVTVQSTGDLEVASSKLSVTGSADLRVQGTLAEPVVVGRAEISGGELFFNGRRYEVENGAIQFANPFRTEPVVNLVVATRVNQYNINMRFIGPIDRMRTTYTSDPPLPPVDVLNLLVTGQSAEAAAANPATPQSLLAGQMAGQVSNRVGKLAGISSLTIDPQIGGTASNPGARMAIQQRVTKNLFFTFATDVTSTQDSLIQLEYQLTKKYSVSAVRDQNGGYSLQMKMHKKF